MNVAGWADSQAEGSEFVALSQGGQNWTNLQLHRTSLAWAGGLLQQGLQPGQPVLLEPNPSADLICAFTAVLRAGGVAVLQRGLPPAGLEVRRFSMIEGPPLLQPVPRQPNDPAQMVFTSGTTGLPRAVTWRHGDLTRRYSPFASEQARVRRSLCALPWESSFGAQYLYLRLLQRMQLVLPDSLHPRDILEALEQHQVQATMLVPTLCKTMLAVEPERTWNLKGLKVALVGGDHCPAGLARRFRQRFGVRLTSVYGLTELGPVARSLPGQTEVLYPTHAGLELRIQGDQKVGLVEVREGQQWFTTADQGWLDEKGGLHLLGRLDDLINQAGFKLSPQVLEEVVEELPGVLDCAVVGMPSELLGQEAVVCVVGPASPEEVLAHCRRRLPPHQQPARVQLLEGLPRTPLGKLERAKLRQQLLCPADLLERMASLIGQPIPEPGEMPFSSLGLDSLGLVQFCHRLSQQLGRPLSPTLCFSHPTPAALRQYLRGEVWEQGRPSPSGGSSIAILGVACRLPGGIDHPEQLWQAVLEQRDLTRPLPWKAQRPARAALLELAPIQAAFFGLNRNEARRLPTPHRLVLELGWQALEEAGYAPGETTDCGVFLGMSPSESPSDPVGGQPSMAVGRLARWLNLTGPALAIDTSCSSSLVAVTQAIQALQQGDCSLALAGGVHCLGRHSFAVLDQLGLLAADGRCKSFSEEADGMGRGEGAILFVLKPLSQALQDGDRVLAQIEGWAVNHDGRSSSLTAPNGLSQQRLIRQALGRAGWQPSQVHYVEAHGSGTPLGDRVEGEALGEVFQHPIRLGTIKTRVGHLEAAAGAAGLLWAVLQLGHRHFPSSHSSPASWLPPQLQLADDSPIPNRSTLRSAVISLGMSGTNACLLVEEGPPPNQAQAPSGPQLLVLSAPQRESLEQLRQQLSQGWGAQSLPAVAHTSRVGRRHFEWRLAVVAHNGQEACQKLAAAPLRHNRGGPKVAFLFTGQGSLRSGQGQQLWQTQPIFRQALQGCEALRPGLLERLWHGPPEALSLFALEWALAQLWLGLGLRPQALLGYSLGDYVAACLAGVFSLEQALGLVERRSQLIRSLPDAGCMLWSELPPAGLPWGHEEIDLACDLGKAGSVLAGNLHQLESLRSRLSGRWRWLEVDAAYHSRCLDPILPEWQAALQSTPQRSPQIPLVSCRSGTLAPHWEDGFRQPVRFAQALQTLLEQGVDTLVEVGPQPVLTALARTLVADPEKLTWTPTLHHSSPEEQSVLEALGQLYGAGFNPRWQGWSWGERPPGRASLPTYPFRCSPSPLEPSEAAADLRQLVAELLVVPADSLDPHQNLLDLGLDSLRVLQLADLLRRRGHSQCTAGDILARPTLAAWEQPAPARRLLSLGESGTGPPLVCLAPAGGQPTCYLRLRPLLQGQRPLYALAGAGKSWPERIQADADALQERLGLVPVHLWGWSLGGLSALLLASEWNRRGGRVESLTLLDPPTPGSPPDPTWARECLRHDQAWAEQPEEGDIQPYLADFALVEHCPPLPQLQAPIHVWWAGARKGPDFGPRAVHRVLATDHFGVLQPRYLKRFLARLEDRARSQG